MSQYPLPLLDYQHEGAAHLAERERTGLFDDMGVGKTAQAIGALDRIGAERAIVVAPAAVREVWAGEFKKFSRTQRRIIKGKTIHDLGYWLKGKADVLLTSYEMATRWQDRIQGEIIDALIFDESHYLKGPESQRTRAMLGKDCDGKNSLASWAARTWFLSGTPMPNDPVDVWSFLHFAGGTALSLPAFTRRYFKSRMGTFSSRQTPREEMLAELKQCIRAVSLRRTKAEAGIHLPPIWITTSTVDGDTREIRDLLRDYPGLEDAVIQAVEQGGLSFLEAQHIATLRRLVGEAKAPAYAKLVAEELHAGLDKVVIFGIHRHALHIVFDELTAQGFNPVAITGDTSENDRKDAVQSFQNDARCRVFVGNVKAAGTGLTLTAASRLDMLEQAWSPADNAQALMRIHRIGQTRECHARFISLAGSIDETVAEVVATKTSNIIRIQGS